MKIHFIAIGGAAMHSLAISLLQKGYLVTNVDRADIIRFGIVTFKRAS